ncbi:MAG: hypothetical protein HC767_12160 [Akkermansiaceae bacterium]|nr:hypothetical protein [Akkermansiaceae bacterium]
MKPIDLFHLSFLFAVGSANVSAQALSGSITVTAPLVREGGSPTISWDVVLPPPTTVTELVDIDATKGTITAKVNAKVTLKAVAAAVRPNTTEWYLVQSKLKIGNSAETLVFNDFHPNISGSLILNPNNQNILAGQTISFTAHCATGTGCLALQNGTWKNTTPAKPTVYSTSPASRWYPNYANGAKTAQGGYFNVALYKRGDSILNLQGALSTVSFVIRPNFSSI